MATDAQPPKTTDEAAQRFYARYGDIAGRTWSDVEQYLGHIHPYPKTIEEWIAVAAEVRDRQRATPPPPPAPLTLEAIARRLSAPFPFTMIELKPGALTKDKKRCLVMPYADLRTYEYRLDEVAGVAGWSTSYEMTARGVVCALTILGVTKSGIGDYPLSQDDENPATSAQAQAFKRACSAFGIGRYLYELPKTWADYDEERRQIVAAERVAWELYRACNLLTAEEAKRAPAQPARATGGGR
jgi:hypothetical protein